MNKIEQQEDKKAKKQKVNNVVKEEEISLDKLIERVKIAVKKEIVMEMRKDIVNLAYRVMASELCVYNLIHKGEIPEEYKQDVMRQEDILSATVESMLNRLKEIEKKQEEERKNINSGGKK